MHSRTSLFALLLVAIIGIVIALVWGKFGVWSNLITSCKAPTCLAQQGVAVVIPAVSCATSYATNLPGIKVISTGSCCDKAVSTCTSLDGMLPSTIQQIITLKNSCGSGCVVTVIGGTETGHSTTTVGNYTHGNGYKVDISKDNSVLNSFIQNLLLTGERGGDSGGPIHSDACGNKYVQESNHWDITIFKTCSF